MKYLFTLSLALWATHCLAQQATPIAPPAPPAFDKIPLPKDEEEEAYRKALSIQSAQLLVGRQKEENEKSLKAATDKVDVAAQEWNKYGEALKTKLKMPKECALSFNDAWHAEFNCPKGTIPASPGEANK